MADDDQVSLEARKLELEIAALEKDATPRSRIFRTLVPLSFSFVTAIVAVLGVCISLYTQYQESENAKAARAYQLAHDEKASHDVSLQQALAMATDATATADRRIAGIYQLDDFWTNNGDQHVVAATLMALLSLPSTAGSGEGGPTVRCAAADAIGSAYNHLVPQNISPDDPRIVPVRLLLYGDRKGQLGLVSHANWLLRHAAMSDNASNAAGTPGIAPVVESIGDTIRCYTYLGATRQAIRKSWQDLRNTNLQGTDLAVTELYQADLHGANLHGADIRNSNLACANLSGADIGSANFSGANTDFLNIFGTAGNPVIQRGASVKQMAAADITNSISITDENWQRWKRSNFDVGVLKKLLGSNFPRLAAKYHRSMCG
jgi:hypothetical protein